MPLLLKWLLMKNDTKILLAVLGLTVAVMALIIFTGDSAEPVDASLVNTGKNVRGMSEANNTLVEFSDFFCPSCKAAEPYVSQLLSKYPKNIKFIYRHFPLPQHPLAFKASVSAESAGMQGKFWEYKEKLFEKQETLTDKSFSEIAKDLGLDLEKFNKDADSETVLAAVQTDMSTSNKLNLSGTPSFFLNGEKVNFNSFESLNKTIESKLR